MMEKVDTLVVDKTGTLTEGKPRVTRIEGLPPFEEKSVLRLAAPLEQASEHPLAAAVLAAASEQGVETAPARDSTTAGYSVVLKTFAARLIRPKVSRATVSSWTPTGTCQPNQVSTGTSRSCSAAVSDRWSRATWRIGWTT